MNRIFLLLIMLASFAFANIDEHKVDVYFANGIMTKKEDAIINVGILEDSIKQKLGMNQYNQHINKVSYAYNSTHSFLGISGVLDAIETIYQKYGWSWLNKLLIPHYKHYLQIN